MLFAKPNKLARFISLDRINAGIVGRWRIDSHLGSFVIDLHQLARAMKADPDVAFGIHPPLPGDGVFHRDFELVDLPRGRIDSAHLVHGVFDKPDFAIA